MTTLSKPKFRVLGTAALVPLALVVAACGSSSPSHKSSAPAASQSTSPKAAAVTISTTKGPAGTYLVGSSGRALYLWAADTSGKSACSGACAEVWTPLVGTASAASGVNSADLGTISRSDGKKQVTYAGHPLYYYAADSGAGTTHGQGSTSFGAKWWLVAPSGTGLTKVASASSKSSSSSSSSGGSSGGGGGWG
jgi:predicted lipoprotein with Yx(FWY)xxD motif